MAILVPDTPLAQRDPRLAVENRLPVGEWRFRLEVVDDAGNVSAPAHLVVTVRRAVPPGPLDPVRPDPPVVDPLRPRPVITDPVRPEPVRPEPLRPDPLRPDPLRPGPLRPANPNRDPNGRSE
jgi:hypothetical protein